MTGNDPSAAVRDVQTLFGVGAVGGLTDGQLLERFVTRRDGTAEASFAALVRRHGPMVWGVCRRILKDPHAADDAFQATFLILVRKAAGVRVDDSLGRWLYGVSRRVAMRARVADARRSAREGRGIEAAPGPDSDPGRPELLAELDEEIGRLPERYRAALVLCDLGGMTHEEAARQLGCAVGTVGSRLARGRERLRDRLTRRGLVPSAGLSGVGPAVEAASAALPMALVDSTARAAMRIAAGEAATVTANVSALLKGTSNARSLTRLLKVATLLALPPVAGLIALSRGADPGPEAPPAAVRGGAPVGRGAGTGPEAVRGGAPVGRAAESPARIIARMVETYAAARSYEDEGEVTLVFSSPTGKFTVKRPFSTRFVRPKLFRYEFRERRDDGAQHRFVIWSDAAPGRSRTWWTIRPEIEEMPLGSAIWAGAGVSGGSSLTVPLLLMPGASPGAPQYLTGMKDLGRVGEEAVDGAPCDRIEGKTSRGYPQVVWIDRATSLVRKITTAPKIPGLVLEETTTYRPRIDVEIAPDRFEFEPPKPRG